MRNLIDACSLFALAIDPDIEEPLGEYTAAGQIVMVCFKGIKCLVKALGKAVDLCFFLFGKVKQVEIIGTPAADGRIDFVDNAVETCHKDCRISIVGVAGSVGVAQLETLSHGRFA